LTDHWVKLSSFATGLDADMARARLEAAGLRTHLRSHQRSGFGAGYQGPVPGGIDLFVTAADAERARELLDHTA
jgi:hypothetical protein